MRRSVFITIPSFAVHGGIRVILEWANHLSKENKVYLRLLKGPPYLDWFQLARSVDIVCNDVPLRNADLIILTSPHAAHYLSLPTRGRKVVFLQMLEHLFRPDDLRWLAQCKLLYTAPCPLITIAQWAIAELRRTFKRTGPTYHVGNGVNSKDFPICATPKDGKTVLVEGWVSSNASKDPENYAPAVAKTLRDLGFHIIAYSAQPNRGPFHAVPHEYHQRPALATLNWIYERATILVKASRYDFRSCAPMEAMTKGTVTVRALDRGDDDLIDGVNCLRSGYDKTSLCTNTVRLLFETSLRNRLADACLKHVQTYTWDYWFERIDEILWK